MQNPRDFRPVLRDAIGGLHRAGFDGHAYVLTAAMEGAYGTSLEMVQAIRGAVLRVERALGEDIPREVRLAFQGALAEVTRVLAALTPVGSAPGDQPHAAASRQTSPPVPCSSS